jgi:hypothetical protein
MKSTQVKEDSMHSVTLTRAMSMGMLPTPKVGGTEGYETRAKRQGHQKAISHLEAFVEYHLLPTPMSNDWKGRQPTETWEGNSDLCSVVSKAEGNGKTSQLNPQFVLEMMGFLPTHTLHPFQKKETQWTEI